MANGTSKSLIQPQGSPTAQLLRLAFPIIAMTASRMVMGFIDFAMVSVLGTEAQAAISPASILVFAFISFGIGMASTVQTFSAQADGRGEPEQGSAYAWQTFYMAAVFGLLVWPLISFVPSFYEWIGDLAHHAPNVRRMEIEYTSVGLWSLTPAIICVGLNSFFSGVQRPRFGLISILISIVFNIVANYALIYGNFGFPEMGIRGAALATVMAWWVRAICLTAFFCSPIFNERYRTRSTMAPSMAKIAGILRIGTPAAIHWFIDIAAWAVFMMVVVPPFGTEIMAASNIALQFMHMGFMPAIGLGMALCSQVGFAIGSGRPDDAADRVRLALRFSGGYMGAIGLLFLVARYPLMRILSDDPEVIRAGARILIWAALFQVSDAFCVTYTNALRGAGDTKWPAIMVGITTWGIFIGGGLAISRFVPQWGFNGPWVMCTLYISTLGFLLWWRFRSGAWKSIRIFESPQGKTGATEKPGAVVAESPVDPA